MIGMDCYMLLIVLHIATGFAFTVYCQRCQCNSYLTRTLHPTTAFSRGHSLKNLTRSYALYRRTILVGL